MADRDFILSDAGAMSIRNGDFLVGESLTQEVALLLLTNKGEIRGDLFCGCDLVKKLNSTIRRTDLERIIRLQVERDGKNWSDVKDGITVNRNA